MDYDFWNNCWLRDSQPFHLFEPHPLLGRNLGLLNPDKKVLLPLSGKSVDPLFLAGKGVYSTSIEFNPIAVDEFINEHQLSPTVKHFDSAKLYQFEQFEIWLADFFALTAKEIGRFSQVFDRASLVALPEELRKKFAAHLVSLLEPNAKILMVTMDYDIAQMDGPPFYVSQQDLQRYFPKAQITEIDRQSLLDNHPRWKELELTYLDEVLYQITLENNNE